MGSKNFNNEQKIAGLKPLNLARCKFSYEDSVATPLNEWINDMGVSPRIFVAQNKNKHSIYWGVSPIIFVTNNKTVNQRGVALTL